MICTAPCLSGLLSVAFSLPYLSSPSTCCLDRFAAKQAGAGHAASKFGAQGSGLQQTRHIYPKFLFQIPNDKSVSFAILCAVSWEAVGCRIKHLGTHCTLCRINVVCTTFLGLIKSQVISAAARQVRWLPGFEADWKRQSRRLQGGRYVEC